jgi:hypothetical protein
MMVAGSGKPLAVPIDLSDHYHGVANEGLKFNKV